MRDVRGRYFWEVDGMSDLICLSMGKLDGSILVFDRSDMTLESVKVASVMDYLKHGGSITNVCIGAYGRLIKSGDTKLCGVFRGYHYIVNIVTTKTADYIIGDIMYKLEIKLYYNNGGINVCLYVHYGDISEKCIYKEHIPHSRGLMYVGFVPLKSRLSLLIKNRLAYDMKSVYEGYDVPCNADKYMKECILN